MNIQILSNCRKKPNDFSMTYKCDFCNDYVDKVTHEIFCGFKMNFCKSCLMKRIQLIDKEYQKEFKSIKE